MSADPPPPYPGGPLGPNVPLGPNSLLVDEKNGPMTGSVPLPSAPVQAQPHPQPHPPDYGPPPYESSFHPVFVPPHVPGEGGFYPSPAHYPHVPPGQFAHPQAPPPHHHHLHTGPAPPGAARFAGVRGHAAGAGPAMGVGPGPGSSGATVTVLQGEMFQSSPVQTVCPHCQQPVVTRVSHDVGLMNTLFCLFCFFVGCDLGCCLIPCLIDDLKDVTHTCPYCNGYIYTYKRIC